QGSRDAAADGDGSGAEARAREEPPPAVAVSRLLLGHAHRQAPLGSVIASTTWSGRSAVCDAAARTASGEAASYMWEHVSSSGTKIERTYRIGVPSRVNCSAAARARATSSSALPESPGDTYTSRRNSVIAATVRPAPAGRNAGYLESFAELSECGEAACELGARADPELRVGVGEMRL